MNNTLFKRFLKEAQVNDRVSWDIYDDSPYIEIVKQIYADVSRFKNYTLDGRFQDILVDLLKDPKYETEGYAGLLKDLEVELNKMVVRTIMMLPLNYIDTSLFCGDVKLNDYINLFMPTKEDLKDYDNRALLSRQEKRRKDKLGRMDDNLCKYYKAQLDNKLDKEHILLAKDRNFFNYPILSICMNTIDWKMEKESGRIAQATYSLLRIIDFMYALEPLRDRLWKIEVFKCAHTYTVYYNKENHKQGQDLDDGCLGFSFMCNFSSYLDIYTPNLLKNLEIFKTVLDLYIKTCFLDVRLYNSSQLKIINKWNNAILMYNDVYEFFSIEKFDAGVLLLCALLESLFLVNEGRNKQERLCEEIATYAKDLCSEREVEQIIASIREIYGYRNKIMHEGVGYEGKYKFSRRMVNYQGIYRGMRPFAYSGAVASHNDILNIKKVFRFTAKLLICDKTLNRVIENLM